MSDKTKHSIIEDLVYLSTGIIILYLCNYTKGTQAFSFYIGVLLSKYKLEAFKHRSVLIIAAIVICLIFAFVRTSAVSQADSMLLYTIVSCALVSLISFITTLIFSYLAGEIIKPMEFLGKISWELYLVHVSLLWIVKEPTILHLFVFVLASFVISHTFNRLNTKVAKTLLYK